uniref:Uncharacterized protein n=1 Tax=Equus asinus TaxID=9793 RepID=A0A8C4LGE8_EQUAS
SQILPNSLMPQWLVAVVSAQGDAWDLWASMLVSAPRILYSAGSMRSSNSFRLPHVWSHRGDPEDVKISSPNLKGCVPDFQATIHSTSFNKVFLHLFFLSGVVL